MVVVVMPTAADIEGGATIAVASVIRVLIRVDPIAADPDLIATIECPMARHPITIGVGAIIVISRTAHSDSDTDARLCLGYQAEEGNRSEKQDG